MKIEDFISGSYQQQYQYKSFSPTPINQEWTWDDPQINTMLEEATQAVSALNAFSVIVPNINIFISMHITKEAEKSSKIEGTQTNIEDAVKDIELVDPEKRDDWQEVQNYIKAMNEALEELQTLPVSTRLLKKTHATLMHSVRGKNKGPGEIRTSQNWIGGSTIANAVFIPPHHQEINSLMSDLENFLHNENIFVPHLIRVAIAHYQFETIHPFQDGNGRIGRLLITLYLISKSFLGKPSLYLSDYLERNKGAYYDALTTVRSSNNLKHWIKFFLTAVTETAHKGVNTFQAILDLKQETDALIPAMGKRAENARKLLNRLYERPAISAYGVANLCLISHPAANALIKHFVEKGILFEATGQKRNRIFLFKRYLELFKD